MDALDVLPATGNLLHDLLNDSSSVVFELSSSLPGNTDLDGSARTRDEVEDGGLDGSLELLLQGLGLGL